MVVRWWCCRLARLFIGRVEEETRVLPILPDVVVVVVVVHDSYNIIISCSLYADT